MIKVLIFIIICILVGIVLLPYAIIRHFKTLRSVILDEVVGEYQERGKKPYDELL